MMLETQQLEAINRKRKAALAKREAQRVVGMLKAPILERTTEEEVLFALSDLIGSPKIWKKYLFDIFLSQHWSNDAIWKIVCFLAYNGCPQHLMWQWVRVRGVVCNERLLHYYWDKTLHGTDQYKSAHFTWDLIVDDYCYLNGEPRNIPESKRSKQGHIDAPIDL